MEITLKLFIAGLINYYLIHIRVLLCSLNRISQINNVEKNMKCQYQEKKILLLKVLAFRSKKPCIRNWYSVKQKEKEKKRLKKWWARFDVLCANGISLKTTLGTEDTGWHLFLNAAQLVLLLFEVKNPGGQREMLSKYPR